MLCVVSFLQDSASELLYPVLPLYLTATLGAPVAVVGFIEGAAEGVAALTKVYSGRVADRWRKRPLVGLGYGLAATGKAVIAVATSWPAVLAGRGVDRFGKGIRGAPRDALLAEGVAPIHRGRAFGLHRAMDTAGAVVGPLMGLGLYHLFDQRVRPLLVIAVVPAVISVAAVGLIREPRTPRPVRPKDAPATTERLPPGFRRAVTMLGVFALVNTPDALLLLRVRELGVSVSGVIVAYVLYNVAYASLSFPLGAFSDRVAPPKIMAAGLLCFAMCYIGLGSTTTPTAVWPLLIVYGGFAACTDGVGKAWISRLVPSTQQGRAQGVYQGIASGGMLAAGVWAGLLWNGTGRLPLVVAGVVAIVVAALLLVIRVDLPVVASTRPDTRPGRGA